MPFPSYLFLTWRQYTTIVAAIVGSQIREHKTHKIVGKNYRSTVSTTEKCIIGQTNVPLGTT